MKKLQDKIGILGGMGPIASAVFLERLMKDYCNFTNARDDRDFPEVLYLSSGLNEFSEKGVLNEGKVKKQIEKNLNIFAVNKVDIIIVVCVSVMRIFDKIMLPKRTNIINLVDITHEHLNNNIFNEKNILVLSSDYTRRKRLFVSNNCKLKYINNNEQRIVNKLICQAMSNVNINQFELLKGLMIKYKAEFVLLGCTELPLIIRTNKKIVIDPLDLAIKECLKKIKI